MINKFDTFTLCFNFTGKGSMIIDSIYSYGVIAMSIGWAGVQCEEAISIFQQLRQEKRLLRLPKVLGFLAMT
jgi:hypothetical protein